MNGVNKVILIGNLGKDPEIIVFDGIKKASFTLATSESYKNKDGEKIEQTEWHNIICWRNLADNAEKILKKGMHIYVEGKLRNNHWEDKDGNKRHSIAIVADDFIPLTRNNNTQNVTNQVHNANPSISLSSIINDFPEGDDLGDLPF
ncbi:MAG: single-stranded DNA-binding protein [Bacteroidales bacterium]|nr:single-stranded DNA-binding protein [Bacteroidales bacterium]